MRKDWIIFVGIIVFVVFVFRYFLQKPNTINTFDSTKNTDMILFWGDGCSYCENVKKYLKDTPATNKLNIDQKEVYYNKNNQNLMQDIAAKCPELDISNGLAVPMAYADNKCLVGDTPIIDWIKTKTATL